MALHETLHIYMSFHLREIRQALSQAMHRTWIPRVGIFVSSVIDRGPLARDVCVREREEERFCV